jgi:hypothetical protein
MSGVELKISRFHRIKYPLIGTAFELGYFFEVINLGHDEANVRLKSPFYGGGHIFTLGKNVLLFVGKIFKLS